MNKEKLRDRSKKIMRQEGGHLTASGRVIPTESLTFNMQNISDLGRRNLRGKGKTWYCHCMTQLAKKLNKKPASWRRWWRHKMSKS